MADRTSAPTPSGGPARRRVRRRGVLVAVPAAGALVAGVLATGVGGATAMTALTAVTTTTATAHAAELPRVTQEAAYFRVTEEGLDPDRAQAMADRAGIRNALRRDGTFAFVDARSFGRVPMLTGRAGKDEHGRRTVARRLDLERVRAIEPLGEDKAVSLAYDLVDLPEGFETSAHPSHTRLTLSGVRGRTLAAYDLDTTVNLDYRLGGHEVTGPGMRTSVTFGPEGEVQGLTLATRSVQKAGYVGIIGPDAAQEQCRRRYGADAPLGDPELVYYAPRLTGAGQGTVSYLLPHWACEVPQRGGKGTEPGKLVPASPELTPVADLLANRDGTSMAGRLRISGGQAPYRVQWSSSTRGALKGTRDGVQYSAAVRGRKPVAETLTATVTDANGITTEVSGTLGGEGGRVQEQGYGGQGGQLASVGVENTVDEWQCAQDSAAGFRSVMQAKGHTVRFDWRGMNAWESDFKRTAAGGSDTSWVDSVDAQWYTGHGSPGGITFKNASHQDGTITPSDARWGDTDLEWMQLESCQVLRDTNGRNDYFGRWGPAFDGLHLLNGFDTNATCIGGGTGRRFAEYLFPRSFLVVTFPALTVQQAWRQMATDLEPSGRVWRSVSPARAGWVTNLDDKFWGQGAVGPDIRRSQLIGYVAISGTV